VLTFYLIINGRKIKYLSSLKITESKIPSVVIIIAVRNEEADIEQALTSVCKLAYQNYRVLIINDRSTDRTAEILTKIQSQYLIEVINITVLPRGWLGKNNALYTGVKSSEEDYLLFTDADVIFKKDVLAKAMNFVVKNDLDHLTILPEIISSSSILKSVLSTFIIMLTALQRPWAAKISTSKASMGVGAFNLVKRKAYLQSGTHQIIAMRPDDDLQLAAIIKGSGGKADVLYGSNEILVEWYKTVKEFINGLMKNAFSGFDYSILKVIGGVVGTLLFFVLPLPLILIFGNTWQRVMVMIMLLFQVLLFWKMPGSKGKWWYGFTTIYSGVIMIYIFTKAVFTNIVNGGIYWRETFYSLTELRKAKKQGR
jgi:cellulose synthase/poly-beta-1,6-N-acetylglucosamine synthase-like glycosyltransferase